MFERRGERTAVVITPLTRSCDFRKTMEDSPIWRYMDFTKYVDLISTKELFFCRSDLLGDPFEGSSPAKYQERRIEEIRSQAKDLQREISMFVVAQWNIASTFMPIAGT